MLHFHVIITEQLSLLMTSEKKGKFSALEVLTSMILVLKDGELLDKGTLHSYADTWFLEKFFVFV